MRKVSTPQDVISNMLLLLRYVVRDDVSAYYGAFKWHFPKKSLSVQVHVGYPSHKLSAPAELEVRYTSPFVSEFIATPEYKHTLFANFELFSDALNAEYTLLNPSEPDAILRYDRALMSPLAVKPEDVIPMLLYSFVFRYWFSIHQMSYLHIPSVFSLENSPSDLIPVLYKQHLDSTGKDFVMLAIGNYYSKFLLDLTQWRNAEDDDPVTLYYTSEMIDSLTKDDFNALCNKYVVPFVSMFI